MEISEWIPKIFGTVRDEYNNMRTRKIWAKLLREGAGCSR